MRRPACAGTLKGIPVGYERIIGTTLLYLGGILGTAPLSNSWIMIIIWFYIALNRTPNIDCYWVGAVRNLGGIQGLH